MVKKEKETKASEPVDLLQSGGLNDEDAHATRPPFKTTAPPAAAQDCEHLGESHGRDSKRRNNVRHSLTFNFRVGIFNSIWP